MCEHIANYDCVQDGIAQTCPKCGEDIYMWPLKVAVFDEMVNNYLQSLSVYAPDEAEALRNAREGLLAYVSILIVFFIGRDRLTIPSSAVVGGMLRKHSVTRTLTGGSSQWISSPNPRKNSCSWVELAQFPVFFVCCVLCLRHHRDTTILYHI